MKNTSTNELAEAWLTAARSGKWEDTEIFARLLCKECRIRVPFGRGIMQGSESEVVQEACLMLFGSFLLRNNRLRTATTVGDLAEIRRHLVASVHTCLRFAGQRIARCRSGEISKRVQISDEHGECHFGSVNHPWDRAENELTVDERCAMALAALQLALEHEILSTRASEMARLTLEAGLTGEEIADRLGVSPSAVSQQLKKVSAKLRTLKNNIEIFVK